MTVPEPSGLVAVAGFLLPVAGILIFVLVLPATRRVAVHRFTQVKEALFAPEDGETEPSEPSGVSPSPLPNHTSRASDPEITKFDRRRLFGAFRSEE